MRSVRTCEACGRSSCVSMATSPYIWTIATSALQEVDRQLQAERARNDDLQVRLQALEARIEALEKN